MKQFNVLKKELINENRINTSPHIYNLLGKLSRVILHSSQRGTSKQYLSLKRFSTSDLKHLYSKNQSMIIIQCIYYLWKCS